MKDLAQNKRAYDKYSEKYHKDLLDSKTNFWHKIIEKPAMTSLLKILVKNKNVLDLGCGSGIYTKKIFSMNAKNVIGLDILENLIEIAKKEKS